MDIDCPFEEPSKDIRGNHATGRGKKRHNA